MPQLNEKPIFDMNQFILDMTGDNPNRPWFIVQFNDVLYNRPDLYEGVKTEADLANIYNPQGLPAIANLHKILFNIHKYPDSPETKRFLEFWKFISPAFPHNSFNNDAGKIMLILQRSNMFDSKAQLALIRHIIYNVNVPKTREMYYMMANNPNATYYDKYVAAKETHNYDIARDAFEALKKVLEEELNTQFPDADKIRQICRSAGDIIRIYPNGSYITLSTEDRRLNSSHPSEYDSYLEEMKAFFNFDRIMALGAKYIPMTTETLEERVADAETKLQAETRESERTIKEKNAEIARLERELASAKQKSENLTQELDKNNKTLESTRQELSKMEVFLKTLQIKIGTLRTGLFSKGSMTVEQFQEWIKSNMPELEKPR